MTKYLNKIFCLGIAVLMSFVIFKPSYCQGEFKPDMKPRTVEEEKFISAVRELEFPNKFLLGHADFKTLVNLDSDSVRELILAGDDKKYVNVFFKWENGHVSSQVFFKADYIGIYSYGDKDVVPTVSKIIPSTDNKQNLLMVEEVVERNYDDARGWAHVYRCLNNKMVEVLKFCKAIQYPHQDETLWSADPIYESDRTLKIDYSFCSEYKEGSCVKQSKTYVLYRWNKGANKFDLEKHGLIPGYLKKEILGK